MEKVLLSILIYEKSAIRILIRVYPCKVQLRLEFHILPRFLFCSYVNEFRELIEHAHLFDLLILAFHNELAYLGELGFQVLEMFTPAFQSR
jgi:hypothetical protein